MIILSRDDIEKIAIRVEKAYLALPGLHYEDTLRVNLDRLCTDLLGLTVEHQRLSLDGSILGLTSYSEYGIEVFGQAGEPSYYFMDGKTILIDSALREQKEMIGRHNFTVAHEASHQILRMLYPQEYKNTSCRQPIHYLKTVREHTMIRDWSEWQADALGSAVLLPADMVTTALEMYDLGDGIHMLHAWLCPYVYERFCQMAKFLGCSKKALAIRLKYLGLLTYDYLEHPEDLFRMEEDEWKSKNRQMSS